MRFAAVKKETRTIANWSASETEVLWANGITGTYKYHFFQFLVT